MSDDTKKYIVTKLTTYIMHPSMNKAVIPAGTPVVIADNLPKPVRFWVEAWDNMTDIEESWLRSYGFLLERNEVSEKEETSSVH